MSDVGDVRTTEMTPLQRLRHVLTELQSPGPDLVLEHIFNAIPAIVVLFDRNGEVVRANEQAREFVKCSSTTDHSVGKKCAHPCELCKLREFLVSAEDTLVLTGRAFHGVVKEVEHDGKKMFLRMDKVPYYSPNGGIEGVLAVGVDVTDIIKPAPTAG